jgi:hypothetical protein
VPSPAVRRYVSAADTYWRLRQREIGEPTHRRMEDPVRLRPVTVPLGPETRKAAREALYAYNELTDLERAEVVALTRGPRREIHDGQ